MKIVSFLILLLTAPFSVVLAETITTPKSTQTPHVIPSPPSIMANAYLVIDLNSGHALVSVKANERVEPASLTKIMTGFVVINELNNGSIKLTDMVSISKKAWKMPGSKMFIEVGKKVSVENLIKGMVIQSGNDASVALAEHIAGSEAVFAELMNTYADTLGMTGTHYMNATGLPNDNHYTTASDLAKLTKALITQFPEEYKWYAKKKFTFNGITQYNRNKLLWQDKTVDGLKTGHTNSAGYCLVSSAIRQDMRVITIVLGAKSAKARIRETQKLLNYSFRFFETHKLYSGLQRLNDARIWEGNRETVGLGLINDLYITIPRGQYKSLKIETQINTGIIAPVSEFQPLGSLNVSLHGKQVAAQPIVALAQVEEGHFIKKLMDQLKQLINTFIQIFD